MTPVDWGSPWVAALAAVALVALMSLSGAAVLWVREATLRVVVPMLVAMAVGVLLGDAFLHLIPEATEQLGSTTTVGIYTMAGFVLFFAIEKGVRWQHRHEFRSPGSSGAIQPMARMNLIGDAVHNFMDGILIAGSFAVDPVLGWATTIAIVVHEIPQELGDTGALLCGGYAPRRALLLNFLCALAVVPGVVVTLLVGQYFEDLQKYLLPIAAGGFIYIAASDFLPALHRGEPLRTSAAQVCMVTLGMLLMYGVVAFEGVVGLH